MGWRPVRGLFPRRKRRLGEIVGKKYKKQIQIGIL